MANVEINHLTPRAVAGTDNIELQKGASVGGLSGRFTFTVLKDWVITQLGALAILDTVGTAEVDDDAVTYAKIQDVTATDRLLGRDTAGAGVIEEIAPAAVRTMINVADGANAYSHPNHTGDVTSSGDGAQTIADEAVTLAKMQHISANNVLGRITGGVGDVEQLSAANVRSIINVADGSNNYSHPNHTGDVTSTGDGAQVIADEAVTYAKMQHVSATARVLGRNSAGAGDVEEITAAQLKAILADEETGTAGETLAAGDLVYFKSDSKWWKTDADAVATTKGLLGIADEAITAESTGTIILSGDVVVSGFTAASLCYVSPTAGAITHTRPATATQFVRILGYAKSTTLMRFNPSDDYVEVPT